MKENFMAEDPFGEEKKASKKIHKGGIW